MDQCAVRGNHRAYPGALVVPPFPDVFTPVGPGEGALAVTFVVLPLPDVFFPVGIGVGAEAVVITHTRIFETWGQGLGCPATRWRQKL